MKLLLILVTLLALQSKSFSQTESSFTKTDSFLLDSDCLQSYTCDELTHLSEYIHEIETINQDIPLLREKVSILENDKKLLLEDSKNLKNQISLLNKNADSFRNIEFDYISTIAKNNTENTELILKSKRHKKTIVIMSSVGGGLVAALIAGIVIAAR